MTSRASKKPRVDIAYEAPGTKAGEALTLYDKIFRDHLVHQSDDGAALLYIDRHLLHEVTSPQAFEGLRNADRTVRRPDCTLATLDHNVPTSSRKGFDMSAMKTNGFIKEADSQLQVTTLEDNVKEFGLTFFGMDDSRQGIVHVIGPEQGFTLPGTTLVCGDSHTATHGAFGALAFGIGTSEVEHVLATQTLVQKKAKNLCIQIDGELPPSTSGKDLMLHIIGVVGTGGGTGYVMEFCGKAIRGLSVEARMSMCNMAIEAGARAGLIAPDETTFEYVKGRPMAPSGPEWDKAVEYWKTLPSDPGAKYDKVVIIDGEDVNPTVSWGTSPQDVVPITGAVPDPADEENPQRRAAMKRSLEYMGLEPNTPMVEIKVDKVFIGSCTNSRIEDMRAAAAVVAGHTIAKNIKMAMVVPGSGTVRDQAEAEGLDEIFKNAGFDWREPGCSMCLGMNPDRLAPQERCASTSNRNFEGRQGKGGRTHLVSPAMAAAAAIKGHFADVREFKRDGGSVVKILEDATGKKSRSGLEFLPSGIVSAPAFTRVTGASAAAVSAKGGGGGMPPFVVLKGVSAALDKQNVDTDQIIPAQFLKTIKRSGLGVSAFFNMRYNADGSNNPEFVLNQPAYQNTSILIAGDNFGCGSSREHAPWAMLDMGIRCVISTSLADIFNNNCFKNGMLPIQLAEDQVRKLMADAGNKLALTIDLPNQEVVRENGEKIGFEVDPFRKHCLINGLDEIALTFDKADRIGSFESARSISYPWLDGAGYSPISPAAAAAMTM